MNAVGLLLNCFVLCVAISLAEYSRDEYSRKLDDGPVVSTAAGQVRGITKWTAAQTQFSSFLGIPYGEPPIGRLRFQPPVTAQPWQGILNATRDPPVCLQLTFGDPLVSFAGEEDCLQLNVYTPKLPDVNEANLLPVNVFVHSGGYFAGEITSTHYGPERYMDANVILVLMNYRVGSLGFLSTMDSAATGNAGLLDQNLALVWVNKNIANFGGDPNRVTLSGQSAGSASVVTHLLSPLSAGLFHQVIAESGSTLCPWAIEENPLYYAEALGDIFQCDTLNTSLLVDCLQSQDAGYLVTQELKVMLDNLTLSFVPSVENSNSGLFLTEDPETLFREGRFIQVPLIIGFNRDEGVLIYEHCKILFNKIDDTFFDEVVPLALTVLTDYRTNLINVSYAIKEEYYDIDLSNATAVSRANIDLLSDMFMKSWVTKNVELIASHQVPVYMYAFNYESVAPSTNYSGSPDVSHSAELPYLFNMSSPLTGEDVTFGDQFRQLWVNFISNGNPTPDGATAWLPTSAGKSFKYLDINDQFNFIDGYDLQRMEFWLKTVPDIVNA